MIDKTALMDKRLKFSILRNYIKWIVINNLKILMCCSVILSCQSKDVMIIETDLGELAIKGSNYSTMDSRYPTDLPELEYFYIDSTTNEMLTVIISKDDSFYLKYLKEGSHVICGGLERTFPENYFSIPISSNLENGSIINKSLRYITNFDQRKNLHKLEYWINHSNKNGSINISFSKYYVNFDLHQFYNWTIECDNKIDIDFKQL